MRRLAAILPGICLALVPFIAKADTLEFNSSPGGGGVGPYSMTLNPPGGTNLQLFCLNLLDNIQSGESWSVNVYTGNQIAGGATLPTGTTASEFEDEAYFLSELGAANTTDGHYTDTDVQDALWKIFDSSAPSTSASSALFGTLGSAGATFISDDGYGNYLFYIYNGGSVSDPVCSGEGEDRRCSPPQNFIGDPIPTSTSPTPEPSALLLLGTGLTGIAGVARRKMLRK